ncbi:MAG: acyl-CoA/acyl-ACP dehydrogenase [Parvularculaceae bacterium]|nr:acyl-CoA/acyl-ACP dehydrogenase [Parvularculaceae bacterium]
MENLGRVGFSEEQAEILDIATQFCRARSPIEKVRRLIADERGFDEDVWKELVELGWLGVAVPEAYGGVGLSLAEVAPIMEQMGRTLLSGPFFCSTLAGQAILAGATPEQKSEYLPRICDGEIATLGLSESNCDWDLANISAEAIPENGQFKLSGAKRFVAHADEAKIFIVSVLHAGAPALVVFDADRLPRSSIRRERVIDETKRSFEINLDGILLGADALFAPVAAEAVLKKIELVANLLGAAELVGGSQAVIDYTIEYLKTRKQFGKIIGSYQALKHPIVDAFTDYEQARSHLYAAANVINEQGTGEIAVRMARAKAETTLAFAADRAIQFHGGFGFTYDCDAQLFRRRAIWLSSQFGDAAYQRARLAELLF